MDRASLETYPEGWIRMPVGEKNTELNAAREALEASERRYRELIDLAPIGIFRSTRAGRFVSVNPALASLLGYDSPDEMLQLDLRTDVYVDGADRDRRLSERAIESAGMLGFEVRWKRRDGSPVWVRVDSRVIRGVSGTIELFEGFVHDIDQRKRAEESFWESEQRYRTLFESMLHGYAYCEMLFENGEPRDFVYLDVNKAFEESTGLKDVVGKRVTEVIPGIRESNPELFEMYGRVALTGNPERFETYVDDLGIWFSISAYSPQKGQFVALFDNITERKRAETEIRKSEERFRRLFDSHTIGIVIADLAGRTLEANDAYLDMLGYAREDLLSGRIRWDELTPPEHLERDLKAVDELRRTGVATSWEKELLRKDGARLPVVIGVAMLPASEGTCIAYIVDLSSQKALEEQLRQSQKMEAVGQLAGGVAHDFNNLLTAILGYADLLASKLPSDSRLQEEIGEIRGAGERAASLTRQLLAFSRKQVLQPVVLRLNDLVGNLEKMLRRLIGEDVRLVTRLKAPAGNVRADRGQLEQVIVNLAVNARDAMPEGGKLTIETADVELGGDYAERHAMVPPGRYTMLAVSDTGVGMDAATQERIFEPFFTTKEKGKGTGLGLSTVYGIVKQSGGYIWVYSEPGKGTTFKVYLPRLEGTFADGGARPADRVPALGTETILLVEDEQAIRSLSRRILEERGYRVLEAAGGESALELVRTYPETIHLLLTDLVMPDMGGTELASRLQDKLPTLRVLFMSGYTDDGVVRNGLLGSGRAFLQKPFTPAMLVRKIRDVLA